MNERVARLLFDECIGRPQVAALINAAGPEMLNGVEARHVFDLAPPGTRDEDWLPALKDQGWTVISADGGRKPNKKRGKKLPMLCEELGITHVLLSPKVHNRKADDKVQTILSVLGQIIELARDNSRRGCRYALEPKDQSDLQKGRLVARPLPEKLQDKDK